jgi:hypothetical protein
MYDGVKAMIEKELELSKSGGKKSKKTDSIV